MGEVKHERIRFRVSTKEMERRWKLIREAMKANNIDSFFAQNNNKWLGGYIRYLIDIPGENAYPKTVFFPADEEMVLIVSGGEPLPPSPPDWAIRGIKQRFARPYFRTLNYTNPYDAQVAVDLVKKRNDKRVGLVGLGLMDAFFIEYLKGNLPDVEFIDFTDSIDEIKAVKSEEEISYIRKAVALQDAIFAAAPTFIRPGRYEWQIRADLIKMCFDLGSEEQLIMIGSAPPGSSTGQFHQFYQNRQIKEGDQVLIMLEVNGPAGFYAEIARTWSLGEPPKELVDAFEFAKEAQKLAASMIKPGVLPKTVLDAINDFAVSKGYLPDKRLVAHGQGYDLVERPGFNPEEKMTFKPNMNLAIHPIALTPDRKTYAFCCDNYLLTADGIERLHKTPQEIIVIDI
ncbi:M24 family metallopeptidase [Moorella sulfitireducens]|uniref:M24 family metallopeptidase n=1 Tax=Neomoorella sulfitireducens TaxID=2972948 RepID=UPI0021AD011A|nr:Xaa-Pro peptidase family protein [Moorella sulfitireducens]